MKKVLVLVLALCMTLCMAQAAMADMLSDIQEKGTLVVGANVGFPPYEFYYTNPETGEEELQGFDMKLAQAIADELGVEMVLADQTFAGLITALRAGEIDMIASGMAIREDRLEVVDFSDPYYVGGQIMMVRAEDADTLTTVESMAGKRVGAQMGALQATILEEQFADSEPQLMDNISLMVMDLLQGSVDGVLLTDLVAKTYIARYPGQLVISQVPVEYDNTAGVAVAVNKGDNASLLEVINSVIERVTTDGTFDAWVDEATALNATLLEE